MEVSLVRHIVKPMYFLCVDDEICHLLAYKGNTFV
jgi:hypothetical protein